MSLETFPFLLCGSTAFLGTILYRLLSRFTKLTKDKVVGITTTVSIIPIDLYVLVIVFKVNPHPDWPWLIIAAMPVITYYLVPIWYRWGILPQLELMEKAKNKK